MEWFDTHAHIDSDVFEERLEQIVAQAQSAGVATMIAVGTTAETSQRCIEIANRFDGVYASVGIQPNYCHEAQADDWEKIVAMASDPRVVALGETGLDKYWDNCPFDLQLDYFHRHIKLSQDSGLPFIVHMRDCEPETIEALQQAKLGGDLNGVMHSFTGSETGAAQCLELGLYVSFAGMVTYKKSDELRAVARTIPANRILIETDSPYLSPHPKRSHRPNEPALVVLTGECLANERRVSVEEFASQTTENAKRLFAVNAS